MDVFQFFAVGMFSLVVSALRQEMMDDGMDGMMGMMWIWWLVGIAVLVLIIVVIWRLIQSGKS